MTKGCADLLCFNKFQYFTPGCSFSCATSSPQAENQQARHHRLFESLRTSSFRGVVVMVAGT